MQNVPKKKKFGQHFLIDKTISKEIAGSLLLKNKAYHQLIEIGPGNGSLTDFLSQDNSVTLFLVEIDRDLIAGLQQKYPQLSGRILNTDFLKISFEKVFQTQTAVIGNFPYNISSQIVIKIIENKNLIPEVVGMFQKEMAERITAIRGKKAYGRLSVMTQAFFDTEFLFPVGREVFQPKPNVESAVIRLIRKESPVSIPDEKLFSEIIKSAFGMRRKQLRNSLAPYNMFFSYIPEGWLTKRAEELSVDDFAQLTTIFHQAKSAIH